MPSQAVVLSDPNRTALDQLPAAYALLEAATEPAQAAHLADQAKFLDAAVRAANMGLEAQNEAAKLRLTAERRLGQLLAERPELVLPEGVSRNRSSRAQKLALIQADAWEQWIANTLDNGNELTHAAALRVAPVTPREERKGIADAYAAPSIDVAIAREWGLADADERTEILLGALEDALATLQNPRHTFVWAKYHGIQDDGTVGESWTFDGIAQQLGWTRPYVESLYYRASHHIRGVIAVRAFQALGLQMAAH